jgi:hypothetical protein
MSANEHVGVNRYVVIPTTTPVMVDTYTGRSWHLQLSPPEGERPGWRAAHLHSLAPVPPDQMRPMPPKKSDE